MTEPVARVRFDEVDEIGIYAENGFLRLIYFDQQYEGVLEIPKSAAGPLGRALSALEES